MSVEVKVNELPESVADGTLLAWHKQPGDAVKTGDALVEIETDKVVLEISAPAAGVLGPHLRKQGDTIKRGEAITTIENADAKAESPGSAAPPAKAASTAAKQPTTTPKQPAAAKPPATPKPPAATKPPAAPKPPAGTPPGPAGKPEAPPPPPPPTDPVATEETEPATPAGDAETDPAASLAPSVRRLLVEHKLAAADITGTGPRGRITKEDVIRHLEHSPQIAQRIGEAPAVVELSVRPQATAESAAARPTTRVRMSRLRARIAERMLEAQRSAAILTTFNEIDMQALTNLRHAYRDAFTAQHGTKLGIMGFFVRACTEALRRYPIVNASIDGDDIVYHGYFDVGVAVSTSRGLVVPVLRDADKLSVAEVERGIADFAARGEEGKLGVDELTGGTFTISNGGIFGSMLSTPILNPPQSAILGLHRIQSRPVAEGDRVVVRPMMYVALSYDHRIIDGRDAVLFLVAVKELIEDPTRFILKV